MGVDLPPALMDLLLKGTILLAAGGLITSAMRRASAASRHAVWAATCVAALALPVARVVAPEVTVAWWPGAEAVDAAVAVTGPAGVGVAGVAVAVGDGLTASPLQPMVLALLLVWGSGAVVLLGRLARGRLAWSRLQRQTTQETDARIQGRADLVAGWMGLLRCRVQRGPDDWMPVTWGLRDPVVALPGTARRWTDARLDIVLVHELAHVRRADA